MGTGRGLRLAVTLSHLGGLSRVSDLLTMAMVADRAGVDQIVLSEHVLLAKDITGHPATSGPVGSSTFPFPPDEEYPEPLVALAAVGAVTRRARLSTNILIAPLRPAGLLAKMAATVDVLSGGRLDLGLGAGWHVDEFEALGVPYDRPGRRLEETVEACRSLWQGGPSTYHGTTVSFRDMHCSPTPVQNPLPVWLAGGPTEATLSRVVRLGQGWSPIGGTSPGQVAEGIELLGKLAAQAGRDAGGIAVRTSLPPVCDEHGRGDLEATVRGGLAFVEAGANVLQLPPLGRFVLSVDEVAPVFDKALQLLHDLTNT